MSNQALSGAVALVTGATGVMASATVRRLAQEGVAIGLVASPRQRLDRLWPDVSALGRLAMDIAVDITDPEMAVEAVEVVVDRFDRLDVLVNNADVMLFGTALHTRVERWDRMVALNVQALIHVTHAAVPYLIDAASTSSRGVADIVNVSSTAGRVIRPGRSVYNLTAIGAIAFSEALRQELLLERVRVGVVETGGVVTDALSFFDDLPPTGDQRLARCVEALQGEGVADAIAYVVTREPPVAVNHMVVRAGCPTLGRG
jgi:NADP-dependent 3-hydroxy acid dehydrogenase YdfG